MTMLRKTTILPGDKEGAVRVLREKLADAFILFIVFHPGAESERVVQLADDAAGELDGPRHVVFAPRSLDVAGEIARLPDAPADLSVVRAITTSLATDRVADVISTDEPVEEVRVEIAYSRAGASD